MLFLLRTILSMFFRPFKIFNRKLKNKLKSSIYGPFKFLFKVVLIFLCFSFLIIILVQTISNVKSNAGDQVTVKRVDSEDETLYPDNPNGTKNGLNLLLINSIETEGYVKEYLSLCVDLQEGKLGSLNIYPDVARTLGVAATEQGSYSGLPILGSPLPLTSNGPMWDKSKNMTLSTAYSEEYSKYGYSSSFAESSNGTGTYYGAWQVKLEYKYQLSKTTMSKKDSIDTFYFPDQMYSYAQLRNWKYTNVKDYFGDIELSQGALEMLTSILYSGSPVYKYIPGDTVEEKAQSAEEIYEWTEDVFITDYFPLLNYTELSEGAVAKFVSIMLNVKNNGKISQETYNYCMNSYQKRICKKILEVWGISESVESYLSKAIDSSLPIQNNYSGIMTNVINGKTYYMVPESTGHFIGEEVLGRYYYGAMLKYAGVDVDPTNPDTYMNSIPDGEWTPSGESAWMSEYGIDPTEIGEKRTKLLNEAHQWLGSWYTWGGMYAPEKDSNGNWINGSPIYKGGNGSLKGFDCSFLTQYCTLQALGIDISRTTYTQIVNSNLVTISASEAKPGDLVYYYTSSPSDTHHVAIFLKNNGDGTDTIIHAPQTGDVVKIASRYNTPSRVVYKRIVGIDD